MTTINYDNLDFLLNLYNDLIYTMNPENQYRSEPITRKGIKLIDLKKDSSFDKNQNLIFSKSDDKIKYLGTYNNRIHFIRKSKTGFPCRMMFGYYDSASSTNMQRGVLYDVAMMYIIAEIMINEKFKHSILPIMFFDVDRDIVTKAIPDFDDISKNISLPPGEESLPPIAYCLIVENFFEMMPLSEFLKIHSNMNETLWKVLFFQVLYALHKLTDRLSQFRHNMLNLDAIMVYVKNLDNSANTTSYKVGDTKFAVPNGGFEIKIGDYDMASTLDYIPNAITGKNPYNDYYDVHYFFGYLSLWLNENSITIPKTITAFIKDIVPDRLMDPQVKLARDFTGLDESLDPKDLITDKSIPTMILKKNNFFNLFIQDNKKMNMSATPIENSTANINELGSDQDLSAESEYVRSITESDSDNPRLLGRPVKNNLTLSLSKHTTTNNKSNKNLGSRSNRMPKISRTDIRVKSKALPDSESDDDIIEKANSLYKSRQHNKIHNKPSKDDSENSPDAFERTINRKVSNNHMSMSKSKSKPSKDDAGEYADYYASLRSVSRPMFQKSNKNDDSDSSSSSDSVDIKSDDSTHTGTATFEKYMAALNKIDMADIAEQLTSSEEEVEQHHSKKAKKAKKSKKSKHQQHRHYDVEDDSSSTSDSDEDDDMENLKHGKKKSKSTSIKRKNKHNEVQEDGYESYLGDKVANRIKGLPHDFVGEVPPHLLHMLPDENGVVMQSQEQDQDMNQHQQQSQSNPMANLLGFGNGSNNGGLPSSMPGGMEPPQGVYSNRSSPGFGSMGNLPSGSMGSMGSMGQQSQMQIQPQLQNMMMPNPNVDMNMNMPPMNAPMNAPMNMAPMNTSMADMNMQPMNMPMNAPMNMPPMNMPPMNMPSMNTPMNLQEMPGMTNDAFNGFSMMGGAGTKQKKYKLVKKSKDKNDVIDTYTGKRDFFF